MRFIRAFEGAYSLHYAECKVQANFHAPYVLGGEYKNCFFFSQKGRLAGYYSWDEMHCLRQVSYSLLMNRKYFELLCRQSKQACRSIIQTTKLAAAAPEKAGTRELGWRFDLFRKEHWLNQVLFVSSMPSCTYLLEKELETWIRNKVSNERRAREFIVALTTPEATTALNEEEERYQQVLLQTVQQLKKKHTVFGSFQRELKNYPAIIEAIDCLTTQFGWLSTQEGNPPYDFKYYLRRLYEDCSRSKAVIVREAQRYKAALYRSKESRKKAEIKLKAPSRIRYIAAVIRTLAHLRMQLRLVRTESEFIAGKLLQEIATRLGITSEEMSFFTTEELLAALLQNKSLSLSEAKERQECYLWEIKNGLMRLYTGSEAFILSRQLITDMPCKDRTKIQGLAASPSKVRGRVKIISPLSRHQLRDCEKMEKGRVLVTGQTRPHLMTAVRKAKAIVTDEGGMSSHSAVVSREYGLPCVVGTGSATKLLKTGDYVEVDAYRGEVKLLRSFGG